MSFAIVVSMIQLLMMLVMMVTGAATMEGRSLDVREDGTAPRVQGGDTRPNVGDLAQRSELVSRRGWYGSVVIPWNNQDMAWLKRDVHDKRGWGNGIPPWMRRRVIVLSATARRPANL